MYDVIVVGGRRAGAATTLLLAKKGLRVLVVDKARLVNTEAIQLYRPNAQLAQLNSVPDDEVLCAQVLASSRERSFSTWRIYDV